MPSINPDGTTMVVDWYNKYLNTEYDGSSLPYLYNYYAGHDNNRDWFMFNLAETRSVIKIAYKEWFPQIWLDEHQMLPGDDIYEQIDRGIRHWDKILLCCSEASLTSWWVDNEIPRF